MPTQDGTLTFGRVQDTGEHLPVQAITNMVDALDQSYQVNEAHLDQVQQSLDAIQVRDYDQPYLDQKKQETIQAIKALKADGNLQAAGPNIKGIVNNLTRDEFLQNAVYNKQLENSAITDLTERRKKYIDSGGKEGISTEQYQIAMAINADENAHGIHINGDGTISGHFQATTVPNYVAIDKKLLENIDKLKPGDDSWQNIKTAAYRSGNAKLIAVVNQAEEQGRVAKNAGYIDVSTFNGVSPDTLKTLAIQTLDTDDSKAYIRFMAHGQYLMDYAQYDKPGKPTIDPNTGKPIYKNTDVQDILNKLQSTGLVYDTDEYGNKQFGYVNRIQSVVRDAQGNPVLNNKKQPTTQTLPTFVPDDILNANMFDENHPTGINQNAWRNYYESYNAKAYIDKGVKFAEAYAYGKENQNFLSDSIRLERMKEQSLRDMLAQPNEKAATVVPDRDFQIDSRYEKLPDSVDFGFPSNGVYVSPSAVTPSTESAYASSLFDTRVKTADQTATEKLAQGNQTQMQKPYNVVHNYDVNNPFRDNSIKVAYKDNNSFTHYVTTFLGEDKSRKILANQEYPGWRQDVQLAAEKYKKYMKNHSYTKYSYTAYNNQNDVNSFYGLNVTGEGKNRKMNFGNKWIGTFYDKDGRSDSNGKYYDISSKYKLEDLADEFGNANVYSIPIDQEFQYQPTQSGVGDYYPMIAIQGNKDRDFHGVNRIAEAKTLGGYVRVATYGTNNPKRMDVADAADSGMDVANYSSTLPGDAHYTGNIRPIIVTKSVMQPGSTHNVSQKSGLIVDSRTGLKYEVIIDRNNRPILKNNELQVIPLGTTPEECNAELNNRWSLQTQTGNPYANRNFDNIGRNPVLGNRNNQIISLHNMMYDAPLTNTTNNGLELIKPK